MAIFLDTEILQGSVATCLMCGEMFSDDFKENLLISPSLKF